MLKALLAVAIVVSALIGWLHADEGGYSLRGQQADFGSPFVNGLVMFFIVGVPMCGFALIIFDVWSAVVRRSKRLISEWTRRVLGR